MEEPRGAHVELVDVEPSGGVLMPKQVLINGVNVGLVFSDGVTIDLNGRAGAVVVTLRLLPSRVTIRGGPE